MKDIEQIDITILETRKADVRRSISIVEESDTDPARTKRRGAAQIATCTRDPMQTSCYAYNNNFSRCERNHRRKGMEKTRARRGRTRGECEREPQSACPPRDAEGLISACAAFTLSYHHPLFPFPPFSGGKRVPLLSATPRSARYHPLFSSTPFVPPSVGFPVVFLLVCPSLARLRFPFSSLDFPSLSSRRTRIFPPPRFAPFLIKRLCLSLSPLLSLACRSVSPPFDTRRSLFARVTHRRGETIRRFPGWHLVSRAAFFLSISPCLFSLSAFIVEAVVTVDRPVDRDETTERGRTTSEVTDVTVNGGGANEGVTGVASN